MPALSPVLEELLPLAPDPFDPTDPAHQDAVCHLAERLELSCETGAAVLALEGPLIEGGLEAPLAARVALKIAAGRRALGSIERPAHVSVVFAMYKEHVRILRRAEHPNAEDFLRRKLAQLAWLFEQTPRHSYELIAVDDGCPEGSGRIAREILEAEGATDRARVLFLQDAIDRAHPVLHGLASTNDSRKGGSIRLGFATALEPARPDHVLLFTDADLSTHLGQVGLLAAPILSGACKTAIASRREPASVVVKGGSRNTRGKLFIYLWKRLVPELAGVIDTQCGFKAFEAEHLRSWIGEARDSGFAFDVEYLLRSTLAAPGAIQKVPVAWIDSEAESTTTELSPYLDMLNSVVQLYRTALPRDEAREPFAQLIESLDAEAFDRLLDNIPGAIADRNPAEFDVFDGVSAADLARAAAGA